MKKFLFVLLMTAALVWSEAIPGQQEKTSDAFFNGVMAYRAFQFDEAARWFLNAAEHGDVEAQFLLGRMHYDGNSLRIDNVTAYMWFDIAAANGLPAGRRYRNGLAKRMSEDEVAIARSRAEEWRRAHPGASQ
ncbi:MAG: hypothetical protein GTO41_05440 [Burkholderiales bacterium]|nr:hypothetical protein [Burkholderiales bacterium]